MIEQIISLDNVVNNWFVQNIDVNSLYYLLFKLLTNLGNYKFIILFSILFCIYFFWKENWDFFGAKTRKYILPFWGSLVVAETVTFILKILVGRVGPVGRTLVEKDPSFPSGHATIAVAFFGILAYLYIEKNKQHKNIVLFVTFVIVFLIGLSRLVLNVHFLSDVLAGYIVGLFGLYVGIQIRKYLN